MGRKNVESGPEFTKRCDQKLNKAKAKINETTMTLARVVSTLEAFRQGMLENYPDTLVKHEEDWSGVSLVWNLSEHTENDGKKYTVGRAIFAIIDNNDNVSIGYSGMVSEPRMIANGNQRALIMEAKEKAELPGF